MKKKKLALIHRSTLSFLREGLRTRDYSFFDGLHGYVYGRWVYHYIGIGVGKYPRASRVLVKIARLARQIKGWRRSLHQSAPTVQAAPKVQAATGETPVKKQAGISFANGYHGKVVPLEAARQLVMVREAVRLTDLEKIIPYKRARDIVLQNPDHIVALECPCRSSRPNPCLPLDVCLIVGEPFASFVTDHHPGRSRWVTTQEAVDILHDEHERGHVHHAFFKDAMLGRFYAICNCCACCCGAMQAHQHGTPMLASSGYTAQVDEDLCIGCGECEQACQFSAIRLEGFSSRVDEQACMGCGVCVSRCVQGALSLERDPRRGEPLEIFSLIQSAAAEFQS